VTIGVDCCDSAAAACCCCFRWLLRCCCCCCCCLRYSGGDKSLDTNSSHQSQSSIVQVLNTTDRRSSWCGVSAVAEFAAEAFGLLPVVIVIIIIKGRSSSYSTLFCEFSSTRSSHESMHMICIWNWIIRCHCCRCIDRHFQFVSLAWVEVVH